MARTCISKMELGKIFPVPANEALFTPKLAIILREAEKYLRGHNHIAHDGGDALVLGSQ